MGRISTARQQLLNAAWDLVWTQGYAAVTIDALCQLAKVKKGSFYHFFPGKAELVIAAIDAEHQRKRVQLDALFSATKPGQQRILDYLIEIRAEQLEMHAKTGKILGCPLISIGCEVSHQEPAVCHKIQSIMASYRCYLETAIRDAMAQGELPAGDPLAKATELFAWFEGLLATARVLNQPDVLKSLPEQGLALLQNS